MNIKEIEAQAKYLAPVIKAAIAAALAEMPKPEPIPGPAGPQGEAGKDATVDLDALKAAILAELVLPEPIPGPAGPQGEAGPAGPQGEAGKDATVDVEAIKSAVLAAVVVPEPQHGRDGADGKDALMLEILPGIDTSKSYVRGTYASYNGGLWRSYERTHGMRGWECIVDGVANVEIKHNPSDPRVIFMGVTKSSGEQYHEHISIPSVIYKEVYSSEAVYEKGDAVTYNGSLFIAIDDAPSSVPGAGAPADTGWRLAVKSGRNGRDLRENASTHDPKKALKI